MNTAVRQEINLLDESLIERKPVLPAIQVVASILVTALSLSAVAGWMHWRLKAPRAELAALTQRAATLEQQMTELAELTKTRQQDPALARRASRLEAQLAGLRQLAERAAAASQTTPLTPFVEGLGRQRPEELWLTRIVLANGGQDLALIGSMLEPGVLPAYLEALGREPAFAGLSFAQLRLARATDDARRIDFEVAAGCLAAPSASAACVGLEENRP